MVHAGGWAVITVDDLPDSVEAAKPIPLSFMVRQHGMTPLVELYDAENLDRVLALGPKLVGVNNRDLRTFVTDIGRAIELHERVSRGIPFVAESGIRTAADVARLKSAGIDAMLVGESLMRQPDIGQAVRELLA